MARPDHVTWLAGWLCRFSVARLCLLAWAPVLDPWDFRATLSDLFHGFKLASLALLSAKYHLSFHSFSKVPENTEKRNMSEIYVKKADLTLLLTRLSLKTWGKRGQIWAKVGSK